MSIESQTVATILKEVVTDLTKDRDIAVAFSGGLDSGIVTALAKECAGSLTLYTVGFGESYDMRKSRELSSALDCRWEPIFMEEDDLIPALKDMISITGTDNPLTLAFEFPMYCVQKTCKEGYVLCGQGSDEIFLGYNKYVGLDRNALISQRASDLEKLKGPTLAHEKKISDRFSKEQLYPFLDDRLTSYVDSLDISVISPGERRKALLKDASSDLGFTMMSDLEKKAAQYGSGMMDVAKKVANRNGMKYSELIQSLVGS